MARQPKTTPPSRGDDWRTFGTSTFEARLHLEETIRAADEERYRLRLARTGIHRRIFAAPINNLVNNLSWIRYPLRGERTWTLTVVHRGEWGDETLLEEVFPNRSEGAVRAEGLIELLLTNSDYGSRLRDGT